ncbi:MAG: TonB-dependent receptor [Spirochaetales bacterium]|nr:TonB-dependent receptor [Spirochaetales bacterium]
MRKIASLFFALSCACLMAQEEEKAEDEYVLRDVVVSAAAEDNDLPETAGNITVINAEQIRVSGAADVAGVLNTETGVDIKEYGPAGGQQNISIRGCTTEQVLVLVDGRRINNPQGGGADLSQIPVDNIERIEIIRGSSAALYGADAVGGVINIITKKTSDAKTVFSLSAENGSYLPLPHVEGYFVSKTETGPDWTALVDTQKITLFLGQKIGKADLFVSGGFDRAGNRYVFKDVNNEDRLREHAGFLGGNGTVSLTLPWKESRLFLSGSYSLDLKDVPGTETSPSPQAEQQDEKTGVVLNFSTDRFFSKSVTLDFENSFTWSEREYTDPDLSIDSEHQIRSYHGRLAQELLFWDLCSVQYGADGGYDYIDSSDDGERERSHVAGFARVPFFLSEKFTLEPALRYDCYSDFGGNLTWNIAAALRLSGDMSINAGLSRSFRVPGFDDLYWPADSFAEGNPDLEPETGYNLDLGIELNRKALQYSGFLFARYVENVILWQPGDDDIWRPANWGEGLYTGIENSLKLSFAEKYALTVNYTFLYTFALSGDYVFSDNKRLPMLPLHDFAVSLLRRDKNTTLSVTARYHSIRYLKVANEAFMPSVFVMNFSFRQKISDQYAFFVRLDNLFNEQYETVQGYPMPGTMLTLGMDLDIKK